MINFWLLLTQNINISPEFVLPARRASACGSLFKTFQALFFKMLSISSVYFERRYEFWVKADRNRVNGNKKNNWSIIMLGHTSNCPQAELQWGLIVTPSGDWQYRLPSSVRFDQTLGIFLPVLSTLYYILYWGEVLPSIDRQITRLPGRKCYFYRAAGTPVSQLYEYQSILYSNRIKTGGLEIIWPNIFFSFRFAPIILLLC